MSIWSITQDAPVETSSVSCASLKSELLSVCDVDGSLLYSLPNDAPAVPSFLSVNSAGVSSYVAVSSVELVNSGGALPVSGVVGEMFYFTGTSRPCWWSGALWAYSDGTPVVGP
jgi:hypothetical protein